MEFITYLKSFLGSGISIIIIILAYYATNWYFDKFAHEKEKGTIIRQIIYLIIVLLGSLLFVITLPIDQKIKSDIISLIGIVLSAGFALSSTTLIGNVLAGLMNSAIKNFNLGDFVKIENTFGRITKKGLFRVEIQTEDRNLTSLSNLYIATNPIKIMRESGTIISTTVTLGYDLDRVDVENCLIEAANNCELDEPFVYITNLGDFSVSYKVHGLLKDTNKYFSVNSMLNAKVMDYLHKNNIEIVSPTFMNQRQVNDLEFIPKTVSDEKIKNASAPEDIIFDKANKADKIDENLNTIQSIDNQVSELKQSLKTATDKRQIEANIDNLTKTKETLKDHIVNEKNKLDEEK